MIGRLLNKVLDSFLPDVVGDVVGAVVDGMTGNIPGAVVNAADAFEDVLDAAGARKAAKFLDTALDAADLFLPGGQLGKALEVPSALGGLGELSGAASFLGDLAGDRDDARR